MQAPKEDRGSPPQLAIIATLGLGKTRAVIEALNNLAPDSGASILAPDHALGHELLGRIRSGVPAHRVVQILGREAINADGQPMCVQSELVKAWSAIGGSVQNAFCRMQRDDGTVEECEHFHACPYQAQRRDKECAIRIGSHAHLTLPQDVNSINLGADITIIDESPIDQLVKFTQVSLDDICGTKGHNVRTFRQADHDDTNADFAEWSFQLRGVLEKCPNPTPADIAVANLNAARCKLMSGYWYDIARDGVDVTPAMAPAEKRKIIDSRQHARVAFRVATLWKILHEIMTIHEAGVHNYSELRFLRVSGRNLELSYSKQPKVSGPLILLDGTADDEILQQFFPGIEIVRINVKSSNVSVHLTTH